MDRRYIAMAALASLLVLGACKPNPAVFPSRSGDASVQPQPTPPSTVMLFRAAPPRGSE